MKDFVIEESGDLLIIKLTNTAIVRQLFIELIGMSMSFIIFFFPYDQVIALNPILAGIYLIPFVVIYKTVKKVLVFRVGKVLKFDRKSDLVFINDLQHCALHDINEVRITGGQNEQPVKLDLLIKNSSPLNISESGLVGEYKKAGRAIARIANVEFWDKRPFQTDLLWGSSSTKGQDIDVLNSHHSRFQ